MELWRDAMSKQVVDQMHRLLAMELRNPKELTSTTVRFPLG
jgi:hypothetical protein